MLTSLERITGMPVVWKDEQVGLVEQAVADAEARRLCGLIIRKGLRSARWCAAEDITLVGNECVLISQKPVTLPERRPSAMKQAFLANGQYAGQVTDGLLHPETLQLKAIQISPGPIHRLFGYCAYASKYRLDTAGSVVIDGLLSWEQLKSQIREEEPT